jgi:hypothetical protein
MAGRASNIKKEGRIRQVMDMIGRGIYTSDIVSTLSKEWECNTRAVYKYIEIVKKIVSKEISEQDVNTMLGRLDYLYQMAHKRGDLKLAAHIEISKAKLTIGEKQKVEHSGEIKIEVIINEPKNPGNTSI